MYSKSDVCAVIITYNCGDVLNKNIESLIHQVEKLLIVDNNSSNVSKLILNKWVNHESIKIIYNDENYGIAFALNQGLEYAQRNNMKLLLTMDQDTIIGTRAVSEMISVLNNNRSIVSVGPAYGRRKSGVSYTEVDFLITSGNLTIVECADQIQGFSSSLFIDSVDVDFSLSLRSYGYKIALANNAVMQHKIGEYEISKILGFNIKHSSHSPLRYYYIYRNHILILRKHGAKHFVFCLKMCMFLSIDTLKLLIVENDKKSKIRMAVKGIVDGFK